jgi:fructan beta-fructosidase
VSRRQTYTLRKDPVVIAEDVDTANVWIVLTPKGEVQFRVRGLDVVYDGAKAELRVGKTVAPLKPQDGTIDLHVLIDRGSVELFANGGSVAVSAAHIARDGETTVTAAGLGEVKVSWWAMKSAWK